MPSVHTKAAYNKPQQKFRLSETLLKTPFIILDV